MDITTSCYIPGIGSGVVIIIWTRFQKWRSDILECCLNILESLLFIYATVDNAPILFLCFNFFTNGYPVVLGICSM